jgi:acyl carrier protein
LSADIERNLRQFIEQEILEEESPVEDPLAAGLLDSLAVEQLIAYIEEEYGVMFADEELVAENFASLGVVAGLVETKRGLVAG